MTEKQSTVYSDKMLPEVTEVVLLITDRFIFLSIFCQEATSLLDSDLIGTKQETSKMNVSLETGNNLLARLNKEQIEAVTQEFGPRLLLPARAAAKRLY